jgi:hypothetical protein
MSKSDIHANSSAKKFGGRPSDYIEIHEMLDSSKAYWADNRHRSIFHHTAGIYYMQKMFGIDFDAIEDLKTKYNLGDEFIKDVMQLLQKNRLQGVHVLNSEGKKIHVRDVAEQHILEDFRGRFIPSVGDYLSKMELNPWMNNAMSNLTNNSSESKAISGVINID